MGANYVHCHSIARKERNPHLGSGSSLSFDDLKLRQSRHQLLHPKAGEFHRHDFVRSALTDRYYPPLAVGRVPDQLLHVVNSANPAAQTLSDMLTVQ